MPGALRRFRPISSSVSRRSPRPTAPWPGPRASAGTWRCPRSGKRLDPAAAGEADHGRDQEQHHRDEEDDLGDFDRRAGEAAEAQDTGDQCDNQKRHNPAQHGQNLCFDHCLRSARLTRLTCPNNLQLGTMVPARRTRKFARPTGTNRPAAHVENPSPGPHIATNPCYEGSLPPPRGAIVGPMIRMTEPSKITSQDVPDHQPAAGGIAARARASVGPKYLSGLNPEQRDAVETLDGPVLVLAGAGTGKTRVLTTRIAHILSQGRARPAEILSVTFTNKAAREMKHRLGQMLGQAVEGMPWLGTFHSIGGRILRTHAELAQLKSNFTVLDVDDQVRLLKQLLQADNIDDKRWPARMLAGLIDGWKNRGLTPSQVPPGEAAVFGNGKGGKLYASYQERLKILNAADFGDLLLENIRLFREHPDVLRQYQGRFKFILVDEYQDTNVAQYLWLRLLSQAPGKPGLPLSSVIPGRIEDANPESRDSGSGPSDHPGMTTLFRDPVDFRHVVRAQAPGDCFHVLLDLLDAGGAGDHACDLRAACEPGEGEFEHAVSARLRECLQLLDDLLVARGDIAVAQHGRLGEARVVRCRRAALVLAGQKAACERKERQQPELVFDCGREQIRLDAAHHEAVFVLAGNEAADIHRARGELGLGDPPGRKIRIADVADLALMHEVVERVQGFFHRRQRIVIVLLIEVDVVGLQPCQARFHRRHDVAARCALLGAVIAHRLGIFGREHDVLATVAEHGAQHRFRAALAGIDVGGVEQGDSEIDRLVDHLARGLEIDALAEIVAAKADSGDAQTASAEIA